MEDCCLTFVYYIHVSVIQEQSFHDLMKIRERRKMCRHYKCYRSLEEITFVGLSPQAVGAMIGRPFASVAAPSGIQKESLCRSEPGAVVHN